MLCYSPIVQAIEPQELINYAQSAPGDTAFYYENLETNEVITYNADTTFKAASTIKLPLVAYTYQLASEGDLDLDSTMTYTSNYTRVGSGIMQNDSVGGNYTLRELAENNMVYSDNIAYYMLRDHVGSTNFRQYISSIGGTLPDPYVTIHADDFVKYIKAYYNLTLTSPYGAEMTDIWQDTIYNDHIVNGTPDALVGHKIGWLPLENLFHDGGVVYHSEPYVLVILNQGPDDSTQKNIHTTLSSMVYEYHVQEYEEKIQLALMEEELRLAQLAFIEFIETETVSVREVADSFGVDLIWDSVLETATMANEDWVLCIDCINGVTLLNDSVISGVTYSLDGKLFFIKDFVKFISHIF